MPVRPDLAYDLLKTFSKLEFQLRRHGDFFRKDRQGDPIPDVAWRKVEERARAFGDAFLEEVPEWARKRLGSPPFSRTLTRRPIKAMRSVHVEAKEVQHRVQARCG